MNRRAFIQRITGALAALGLVKITKVAESTKVAENASTGIESAALDGESIYRIPDAPYTPFTKEERDYFEQAMRIHYEETAGREREHNRLEIVQIVDRVMEG